MLVGWRWQLLFYKLKTERKEAFLARCPQALGLDSLLSETQKRSDDLEKSRKRRN